MTSRIQRLVDDLNHTNDRFSLQEKNSELKISESFLKDRKRPLKNLKVRKQKMIARFNYQDFTNMTKQQQRQKIWDQKKKKKQWSNSFYMGNNKLPYASKKFSVIENKYLQDFPDNNTKYNIQFLQRSLHGTNMKFSRWDSGDFHKPSENVYTKKFRPVLDGKLKFNEDWELRASLFGKTWVDEKRDRIMDKYEIQTHPFKTPRSNSLICRMNRSQIY